MVIGFLRRMVGAALYDSPRRGAMRAKKLWPQMKNSTIGATAERARRRRAMASRK